MGSWRHPAAPAWALALALAGLLAGCGGTPQRLGPRPCPRLPDAPGAPSTGKRAARPFAPDAVWNRPLPANAPLDPSSAAAVRTLAFMAQEAGASISIRNYGVPLYIVGPDQPCVVVRTISSNPALRRAFEDVPLPPHAQPALGTDGHLALWQPSRDVYWEFFRLANDAGAWQTQYGGRIVGLSHNPGYFVPLRSPSGAVLEQPGWGATATSLPLLGGLVTFTDLRRGRIDHALAIAVPRVRRGVMAWPAERSDGRYTGQSSLPEGARFRIDPKLDLKALHLSPLALMLARAAQRYGMIIRDGGSRIAVYGQAPAGGRLGPYRHLMRGRAPYNVLDGFPWSRMQLIRMKLRPDDQ